MRFVRWMRADVTVARWWMWLAVSLMTTRLVQLWPWPWWGWTPVAVFVVWDIRAEVNQRRVRRGVS